jgi:hypothetical protein
MVFWDDDKDTKRTLGIRDKQILYRNAKGRCQNPACNKKIDFDEMQVGHKTAWSRGGRTTLKNSVCLCYRCNKLQGTDSCAEEDFFSTRRIAPTKRQYINKLSGVVTASDLRSIPKETPKPAKKRVRKKSNDSLF